MSTGEAPAASTPVKIYLAVLVAALGYFVDIYDLILFNVVRLKSLKDLGFTGEAALDKGFYLLDMQMIGMLVGGVLWGVLADKRGRLSVLFGSILMYSLANIANGFVGSIGSYAALRFIAGVGLAGELGAGITLVSESMPKEARGYGTTIVATIGICGAVAASLVGKHFDWRVAYFVGGGLGLALLALRIGVFESGMYEGAKKKGVARGNFFQLFTSADRAKRYVSIILVGVPIWYAVAILIGASPEIGAAMGMQKPPNPADAVLACYAGLAVGDFASGALSQIVKSRKKVLLGFLTLTAIAVALYFGVARSSLTLFYAVAALLGFATGYWAVFVTVASEQFGTNLRGTATTTAPNFVRGAVVPVTALFKLLSPYLGKVYSALAVGVITITLALVALRGIEETFGKDLDFLEQ